MAYTSKGLDEEKKLLQKQKALEEESLKKKRAEKKEVEEQARKKTDPLSEKPGFISAKKDDHKLSLWEDANICSGLITEPIVGLDLEKTNPPSTGKWEDLQRKLNGIEHSKEYKGSKGHDTLKEDFFCGDQALKKKAIQELKK